MAKKITSEVMMMGSSVESNSPLLASKSPRKKAPKADVLTSRQIKGTVKAPQTQSLAEWVGKETTARIQDEKIPPAAKPVPAQAPPLAPVQAPVAAPPKPALKNAEKPAKRPKPLSIKAQSKMAAKATVGAMVNDMKSIANQRGGYVMMADIDNMQGLFEQRAEALASSLENSFDAFASAREKSNWDKSRKNSFGRLMVKKFSRLFPNVEENKIGRLSRRMLPGFFQSLEMMLGPELIEAYNQKCIIITGSLRKTLGDEFDWEDVYNSREAAAVTMKAIVTIASSFDRLDKRSEWFINLINSHLETSEDPEASDADWTMDTTNFKHFLAALLTDLAREIMTDAGRTRASKVHGMTTVKAATRVIKELVS